MCANIEHDNTTIGINITSGTYGSIKNVSLPIPLATLSFSGLPFIIAGMLNLLD